MKKLIHRFSSRINNKLILLSVIPVAVVTAIITWHTIDTRRTEIRQYQLASADQLAKNLANISDFALYSGREELLAPLANSAREAPSIAGIFFLDPKRNPLLPNPLPDNLSLAMLKAGDYSRLTDSLFVVEYPVYMADVAVSDYEDLNDKSGNSALLGWVVVAADNSESMAKSREILITHLLISFSVLLGAVLLTYMLSNKVVSPITAMTAVVRELERGNLDARISPTTGDELAILANGINHLAKAVADGRGSLENKVALATQKLTATLDDLKRKNHELETARKDAEAASVAKGDFLAQMSHELRTPITAIQGFVKLLGASDLKASEVRYCHIIQQASAQLLQLIDDILDITRLQSNAISIEKAPFNLADCIEAPVSLMAPTAHGKGLELILDIAANVPYHLVGDSLRIRQIVYNLVSNAIKFTPSGHVILKVRARRGEANNLNLFIQVIDTGIGIPDQQHSKLFGSFSQADTSISRRFGGSGLGLSIVKRLVELMDGHIGLESTAGKGTIFTLALPLSIHGSPDSEKPPQQKCALLFDTHPQSRQALENRLGRYVEVINSCENFTDLEINGMNPSPDIIIYCPQVDLNTEQMSDAVARLRPLSENCHIVVFTPATDAYKNLPGYLLDNLQPISFIDKPPMSTELAKLFSRQKAVAGAAEQTGKNWLDARILAAEDNEFTRILLATFFDGSGCELYLVSNGKEAIDACKSQSFDLILLDVHMPEINGIMALKAIRADGANCDTPIVMLTADILQQEEKTLFEAGASDLVFKPFDEEKLLATIHKHLKTSLSSASNRSSRPDGDNKHKQLFVQEIARLAELARSALESRDGESLKDTIHQLLGIAGVYRMTYLERAVQALHQAVKAGNGNKTVAAMETLMIEVETLVSEPQSPN
ncbi:MAG: ATP-binding protein [Porticoccaceae bacterium]